MGKIANRPTMRPIPSIATGLIFAVTSFGTTQLSDTHYLRTETQHVQVAQLKSPKNYNLLRVNENDNKSDDAQLHELIEQGYEIRSNDQMQNESDWCRGGGGNIDIGAQVGDYFLVKCIKISLFGC